MWHHVCDQREFIAEEGAMRKTSGTDERAGRRRVRDLPPRGAQDIKGGWDVPVIETAQLKTTASSELSLHSMDTAVPVFN
jgi:hypothetical protein